MSAMVNSLLTVRQEEKQRASIESARGDGGAETGTVLQRGPDSRRRQQVARSSLAVERVRARRR